MDHHHHVDVASDDRKVMQTLIERHFKSPELRNLAQRVILSSNTVRSPTRRSPRRTRPASVRVGRPPKLPARGALSPSSSPGKPSLRNPPSTSACGKQSPVRSPGFRPPLPAQRSPIQQLRKQKHDKPPVRHGHVSLAEFQASNPPPTGLSLANNLNGFREDDDEDLDWGDVDVEPPKTLRGQMGESSEAGQTMSGAGDEFEMDANPIGAEGPILLEFHRSQALEEELRVDKMVFDSVNQTWVNTVASEEEDIMADFSDSESDDAQPAVQDKSTHHRTLSSTGVRISVEDSTTFTDAEVKQFQTCETDHNRTAPRFSNGDIVSPEKEWLTKMSHLLVIRNAKRQSNIQAV